MLMKKQLELGHWAPQVNKPFPAKKKGKKRRKKATVQILTDHLCRSNMDADGVTSRKRTPTSMRFWVVWDHWLWCRLTMWLWKWPRIRYDNYIIMYSRWHPVWLPKHRLPGYTTTATIKINILCGRDLFQAQCKHYSTSGWTPFCSVAISAEQTHFSSDPRITAF